MTMPTVPFTKHRIASLLAVALLCLPCLVHADERADVERSKQMTLNLIQALVDSGVITQDKADKLIADAQAKADAALAAQDQAQAQAQAAGPQFHSRFAEAPKPRIEASTAGATVPATTAAGVAVAPIPGALAAAAPVTPAANGVPVVTVAPTPEQLAAPVIATIPQTQTPDVGADGKRTVHVAYIPEATKREMREQIKSEVLAQAKEERWGDPGALPDWLSRVSISGDVRFRNEYIKMNPNNTPAGQAFTDGVFTRAAPIVGGTFGGALSQFDTQKNYDFWSLRARMNIDAKVNDQVSAGLMVSTGSNLQRTSTSQNLGQNFDYYSIVIDKAFIKYDPFNWLSVSAGRIANPFFSTDLLFADDLNFEGVAVKTKFDVTPNFQGYLTGGWFPLRQNQPGTSTARTLGAAQAGFDWKITPKSSFKTGLAIYDYLNIAGEAETDLTETTVPDYVSRYEYPAGFRQMGNTLFIINAPDDPNVNWGLASEFREADAMAQLDLAGKDKFHLIWTSDFVKNLGFNLNDIYKRTGYRLRDGRATGFQEKLQIGSPVIKERGDWNMSLAYRNTGSDAVLDAFVNPDFGLGSTNTKGFIFATNYGFAKNSWVTARFLTSNLIDSMVPQHDTTDIPTKLNTDVVQIELNARY